MKFKVIAGICILIFALAACQSEADIEYMRYYTAGKLIYQGKCQNCHGGAGQGLQALMPPLTDTVYLHNNKTQLPCIIKNGMKGDISLAGKFYQGEMPPVDLSPVEIAEVLTYVTNSFGNKMGTVTTDAVNADLKGCK